MKHQCDGFRFSKINTTEKTVEEDKIHTKAVDPATPAMHGTYNRRSPTAADNDVE